MSTDFKVPPGFDEAPKDERIAFVQDLWDRIAQAPEEIAVPPDHQRILEERLEEYRANPQPGSPWSEVRDRLLAKLRRA